MKTVQSCFVYGLPDKDTVAHLTELEAFQFGYKQALQGIVAIYMGVHVAAFEQGCKSGAATRVICNDLDNTKADLKDAREELASTRISRDGLVNAIKAVRAELQDTRAKLATANGALARQALNRSILFSPFSRM